MKYISIQEIIECNALLKEKNLAFKIHLRDACGKQSCWIEPLGECACEGGYEALYEELTGFFKGRGFELEYDDDKINFWVAPQKTM